MNRRGWKGERGGTWERENKGKGKGKEGGREI